MTTIARRNPNPDEWLVGKMLREALQECEFVYAGADDFEIGVARLRDAIHFAGFDLVAKGEE